MDALSKDIVAIKFSNFDGGFSALNQDSGGNQGASSAFGANAIEVIVDLEGMIHAKYPDSQTQNYKGMSKKLI